MDTVPATAPAAFVSIGPLRATPHLRATVGAAAGRPEAEGRPSASAGWLLAGGAFTALALPRGRIAAKRAAVAQSTAQVVDVQDEAEQEEQTATAAPLPCACPICQRPFGSLVPAGAVCQPCGVGFPRSGDGFLDLTLGAAKPAQEISRAEAPKPRSTVVDEEEPSLLRRLPFVEQTDAIAASLGLPQSREVEKLGRELIKEPQRLLTNPLKPAGTSTFQSPLVSFAYERGWRESFARSGFPGPDEEFRLAQEFLREGTGLLGDTLLDASCGSGLFSRRFTASGDYSTVIALDFSEAMLRQVDDFARQQIGADYAAGSEGKTALQLVRADIARLPFASGSLGGVHAGAAIHCWPNPDNAVAEVSRILRPGGVFVLTTFMPRGPLAAMGTNRNPYKFWTEEELRSLTSRCGLTDFKAIIKDPAFIMVRVKKPTLSEEEA